LGRAGPELSFEVRAGEIVGLAGLVGSGRSHLARALFGLEARSAGSVSVAGRELAARDPRAALRAGIAFVPEDRGRFGLMRGLSVGTNWSIVTLRRFARAGWVARGLERRAASAALVAYDVRPASPDPAIATLSGGNQQKVLLARWLAREHMLLIVDEPTRGV